MRIDLSTAVISLQITNTLLRTKVIYNLSPYGYKPTDTLFRLNLVGENDSKTKCQTSMHT